MMQRILVAIPTYNERDHVEEVVAAVRGYVSDILVVDDGSTDGTRELIRGIDGIDAVFHDANHGYGQALITAFGHALFHKYDWLITIDCDHQHEPAYIPKFQEAIAADDADIISGTRYLRTFHNNGTAPADRRRINQIITEMLNERLGTELTDSFCGFKAYRVEALKRLSLDVAGYAMPLQLWVQVVDRGLRIREIPVRLIYNDPNRHFGGGLDDPESRLAHYMSVLDEELRKSRRAPQLQAGDAVGSVLCP